MGDQSTYTALQWPDENLKKAGLYSLQARRAVREMERLVEQRGEIPAKVWGADARRWQTAAQVSTILKDTCGWESANFLPDDPVDILLWHGCYDLAEVEAMMEIDSQFFVDLWEDQQDAISEGSLTLGQLVDYLLENGCHLLPLPRTGEESLESCACPKRTVFIDLRGFVQRHCHANSDRLRPSTRLDDALPRRDWLRFERFVRRRFGAGGLIKRRFLGVASPGWSWLVLSGATATLVARLFWWQLPGWVLGLLFGLVASGIVVMRLSPMTWPRGVHAARDVVEWILDQRERISIREA